MSSLADLGKLFICFGIILILLGLVFTFAVKIPHLGRLTGDITIHAKRTHFYFPVATSLIISFLLTIIINVFFRHK